MRSELTTGGRIAAQYPRIVPILELLLLLSLLLLLRVGGRALDCVIQLNHHHRCRCSLVPSTDNNKAAAAAATAALLKDNFLSQI